MKKASGKKSKSLLTKAIAKKNLAKAIAMEKEKKPP